MKIILDSNVLISAFAARGICADVFREVITSHELVLSDYILGEVLRILVKKMKTPKETASGINELLNTFVVKCENYPQVMVKIRDPNDEPIISFAMSVKADLLITGDNDFLDIAEKLPLKTISPRQFFTSR